MYIYEILCSLVVPNPNKGLVKLILCTNFLNYVGVSDHSIYCWNAVTQYEIIL